MAAMVASVVVAALGHMSTAGMLEATVPLVVGVGALPALALVAFIELLVLDADIQVGKKRKARAPEKKAPKPTPEVIPAPKSESKPEPKAEPKPAPTLAVVAGELPSPENRVKEAVAALGEGATYPAIIAWSKDTYGFGVSKSVIAQVRAAAN